MGCLLTPSWALETDKKTYKNLLGQAATWENIKFTQAHDKCKVTAEISITKKRSLKDQIL